MDRIRKLIDKAKTEEPAVALGAIGTVLLEVQDVIANGHATSWRTALPLIGAFIVRRFVFAPASVDRAYLDKVMSQVQVPDDPSALS